MRLGSPETNRPHDGSRPAAFFADPALRLRYVVAVLATLVFSVLIPVLLNILFDQDLTGVEQTFIGLLISILLGVGQVGVLLAEHIAATRREANEWRSLTNAEDDLVSLRRELHAYDAAGQQLFYDFFARSLHTVANRAARAHSEGLQLTRYDDDATAMMLRAYDERTSDVLRMVHFLGDNDFFYDTHARDFFRDVYERVASGHIARVKRLLIWEDKSQLVEQRTRALTSFHHHTHGFEYRFLAKADFETIRIGLADMPPIPRDFGIYDERFCYVSTGATAADAIGLLVGSDFVLERLTTYFEKCWTSTSTHQAETHLDESQVASLDLFFRAAGAEPRQIHGKAGGWLVRTKTRPVIVRASDTAIQAE